MNFVNILSSYIDICLKGVVSSFYICSHTFGPGTSLGPWPAGILGPGRYPGPRSMKRMRTKTDNNMRRIYEMRILHGFPTSLKTQIIRSSICIPSDFMSPRKRKSLACESPESLTSQGSRKTTVVLQLQEAGTCWQRFLEEIQCVILRRE